MTTPLAQELVSAGMPWQQAMLVGAGGGGGGGGFGVTTFSIPGVWWDIRDFGDISSGNITAALQSCLTTVGASNQLKTVLIPQGPTLVSDPGTMQQDSITIPDPSGDPGWTLLYACKRIQFTSTLSLVAATTIKGVFGSGQRGQGTGALGPNGPHFVGDHIAAGSAVIDIVNIGTCRLENLLIEPGGGASYSVNFHRSSGLIAKDCEFGGCTASTGGHAAYAGLQPGLLINGSFWSDFQDCRISSGDGSSPAVWFLSDVPSSDVAGGLAHFQNITTFNGQIKIGPFGFGPNAGDIHIDGMVSEDAVAGSSLVSIDSSGVAVLECTFNRIEGADSTPYTLKNTGSSTSNITITNVGLFTMDPASTPVNGLYLTGGANAGGGGSGTTIVPTYAEFTRSYPGILDQRLVATPRAPQWIMGTVLNVAQDGSTGAFNTGNTTLTTGVLAPDGSTQAFSLVGTGGSTSERWLYAVDRTVAVGDWFIFGCWLKDIGGTASFGGDAVFQYELAFGGNTHGTETNTGGVVAPEDGNILDGAWHWTCLATKLLSIGSGLNPCNVRIKGHCRTQTIGYFNPCAQYIPVTSPVTSDQDIISYARSLKGGWATQNNVSAASQVGILDHQSLRGGGLLPALTFGTLPASPIAGMTRYITNSNTATWGATVAAGGTNKVMVWYNGTNWTVVGA